mmetsp:Transcript_33009/g.129605  ORF Transcript_33009/g.129605 Transcript_33009/m.129605 type:complete len:183 (+) Transcript_33009:294-842(+)
MYGQANLHVPTPRAKNNCLANFASFFSSVVFLYASISGCGLGLLVRRLAETNTNANDRIDVAACRPGRVCGTCLSLKRLCGAWHRPTRWCRTWKLSLLNRELISIARLCGRTRIMAVDNENCLMPRTFEANISKGMCKEDQFQDLREGLPSRCLRLELQQTAGRLKTLWSSISELNSLQTAC